MVAAPAIAEPGATPDRADFSVLRGSIEDWAARLLSSIIRRAEGTRLFRAFFYASGDDEVPLGESERWIEAVPWRGDTVTLLFAAPGEPPPREPFTGEVVEVQWTFEPSDAGSADSCTVDITLRELRVGRERHAE